jgi:hypothetical protein
MRVMAFLGRFQLMIVASVAMMALAGGRAWAATGGGESRSREGGEWTLREEVGHGVTIRTGRAFTKRELFDFRLPAGARQGPETWFLVKLHYVFRLRPNAPTSTAYLGASTNGFTSAQIVVDAVRRQGRTRFYGDSAGYVESLPELSSEELTIRGTYFNYLPYRGVRPGRNTFEVDVEQYDGLPVRSVRILAGSGIVTTPLAPDSIRVGASIDAGEPEVGSVFELRYRVSNRDPDDARDVVVALRPSEGLAAVGPTRRLFEVLPGGASARGTFRLRAVEAGRREVGVWASALGQSPSAWVDVRVVANAPPVEAARDAGRAGRSTGWLVPGLAIGVLLAVLVAVGLAVNRFKGAGWQRSSRRRDA